MFQEMATYHEELAKAGVLLEGSGLQPSSKGWRVRYDGQKRTVVDGPFTESKELIAGYTLIQVRDRAEALEWSRRFPQPGGQGPTRRDRSAPALRTRRLQGHWPIRDAGPVQGNRHGVRRPAIAPKEQRHVREIYVNLPIKNMERAKAFFRSWASHSIRSSPTSRAPAW